MHLLKTIFTLTILTILGCQSSKSIPKSYEETPVLLHLSASKQADSVGFNLVRALPELLYAKLLTGDIAIWENSDKKSILGAQQFAI
jgi:hypothetical protein